MTRRGIRPKSGQELRRDYPIADRVPNWFFRIVETSSSAWQAEGRDLWGRRVSRAGSDPEALLEACIADACAIAAANSRPTCATCERYDEAVEIHGPQQLRRIVGKIQQAVEAHRLRPIATPANIVDFSALDLTQTLPDVIDYRFECRACGRAFELSCECYHGPGGHWHPA